MRERWLRADTTDDAFPEGFGAVLEPDAPIRSAEELDRLVRNARITRLRARRGAVVVPRACFAEGVIEGILHANQAPRTEEELAGRFGAATLARVERLVAEGRLDAARRCRERSVERSKLRWTALGNASPNQSWLHAHPGLGAIEFLYARTEVHLVACARAQLLAVARLPREPRCSCSAAEIAYARACDAFYAENLERGGFGDYVTAFDRIGREAAGTADGRHAICVNRERQRGLGLGCLHLDLVEFGYVAINDRVLHARDVRRLDERAEPACYRQRRARPVP